MAERAVDLAGVYDDGRPWSLSVPVLVRSGVTLRPPASIGGPDATDSVNAWLASAEVPAGSVIDLNGIDWTCQRGIKQVTKPLVLRGDWFLRRTQRGPRPRPATWLHPHLWLHPQSRIELGNSGGLKIEGTNTAYDPADSGGKASWPVAYFDDYAFEAGVRMDNPDGALVQWERIRGVWGDLLQFGGKTGTRAEYGGSVGSRAIGTQIGRQGVTPGSWGVYGHDVDLTWGRRSGIDLEPDPANTRFGKSEFKRMSLQTLQLPIASAGQGADVNDVLFEDISELSASMPVIHARSSDTAGRRDRWTIRRWQGSPSNTTAGTPALRIARGRDWLIEDSSGFGATGVAGAVKGIEFVGCGGHNIVRGTDLRPKGTIVADPALQDPDFLLELGRNGVDDNRYL